MTLCRIQPGGLRRLSQVSVPRLLGHQANLLITRYHQRIQNSIQLDRHFSTSYKYAQHGLIDDISKSKDYSQPEKYTTAFAIFEALWEAGVSHCFVNVGSDHPSILEAFVKGKRERPNAWPRMITCPSEVTAISIADGYARITGHPQAVLVHVDVGTQALGQGMHNASLARVPVIVIAGLCSITESGELTGSKTEYSNWLQDIHDQTAIVRQYCRHVGEIRNGVNVKQVIARAIQFAESAPKGPVYLTATREVLAQEIKPYSLNQKQWVPIGPAALPDYAVEEIVDALVHAERPLIITGYSGRDRRTPELLIELANLIPGIRIHDTGGSDVCFPVDHPASEGFRLSTDECTKDADVILMLDCDIPWIPSRNPLRDDVRIYHVDVDPLNEQLRVSYFPADGRWRADSYEALLHMIDWIKRDSEILSKLQDPKYVTRKEKQIEAHKARMASITSGLQLDDAHTLDGRNVGTLLKSELPDSSTFVVEAVTNSTIMHDQLKPTRPGSWVNCGATGIGWSNGAALGVKLASQEIEKLQSTSASLVCQVIGDGSFMCAAPSSALWVASKYKIPILTVVLNNGGWKAPRNSVEMVYPDGLNRDATGDELNISFRPTPNFAALAEAAAGPELGWMKGVRVRTVGELKGALLEASNRVGQDQKGMLIEVLL